MAKNKKFQKQQLTDRGYDVYVNERVPSGDGGISLGQAYALTQ
jgi:hydrogenase maturation protein HypF